MCLVQFYILEMNYIDVIIGVLYGRYLYCIQF